MEEWKSVEGLNGKILVSNYGRIMSCLNGSKILKQQKDGKGYLRVSVTVDGIKHTLKVHRVVAKAFICNKDNLPQVNHIDGNKENNNVSNLEWVTNKDNSIHAIRNGLWDSVIAGATAENNKRKKRVLGIDRISNTEKVFESVAEAERFLSSRHISDVLKGKRKTVKGWTFSYIESGVVR